MQCAYIFLVQPFVTNVAVEALAALDIPCKSWLQLNFWLLWHCPCVPRQCFLIPPLYYVLVPHLYTAFSCWNCAMTFLLCQAVLLIRLLIFLRMDHSFTWRMLFLKASQLCWGPLTFRAASCGIPPTSPLNKAKFLSLESRVCALMPTFPYLEDIRYSC